MAAAEEAKPKPILQGHVVLLVHGLVGKARDFKRLHDLLLAQPELTVVAPTVNDTSASNPIAKMVVRSPTHDGVKRCASRIVNLLMEDYTYLPAPGKGPRLSVVGHSMGGLIAREMLGQLETRGFFDSSSVWHATAGVFISVATPHLGVWESHHMFATPLRMLGPRFCGETGLDLAHRNDTLLELVRDDCIQALRRCEQRYAFGALNGDLLVGPCTSLLMPSLPKDTGADAVKGVGILSIPGLSSSAGAVEFPSKGLLTDSSVRERVSTIFSKLLECGSWQRFGVVFKGSQKAHVQIIAHDPEDATGVGMPVIERLCTLLKNAP